jgi:ribonuclease PH
MTRHDGRAPDALRPITIKSDFTEQPMASVLIQAGRTMVLCTASVEEEVPRWMKGEPVVRGWITAEYAMLPASTNTRSRRESTAGKVGGRTQEIQRLIGRSLRAVADLEKLGGRTITIDCDVLQADGGTRTASITGGFVALALAVQRLHDKGLITELPLVDTVAAISCGIVGGAELLDLPYVEDAAAEVDMNVVMTGSGRLIEVQGTGEESTFTRAQLNGLLDLAEGGVRALTQIQRAALPQTALMAKLFGAA